MSQTDRIWEDMISLNSSVDGPFEVIGTPQDFCPEQLPEGDYGFDLERALSLDTYQLPNTGDREGYYGDKHFQYWLSGLEERKRLMDYARHVGAEIRSFLDLGCASGRVIRHIGILDPQVEVFGCDINRRHVEFCTRFLPESLTVFQNHSVPSLPLPDCSIDFVTAFSVFTHIEALETTWLMELRRILRPGGLAWITVHSEKKILASAENVPHFKGITKHPNYAQFKDAGGLCDDRIVFRWRNDASYSSNTVYSRDHIIKRWARLMPIREYIETKVSQDVVIFQKG